MRSQNLRNYLEAGIQSLMPQAQRLLELRRILAGTLPPNLQRSCTIANYMQGKVVIFAENSAVAAKLKLMLPDLRDHFVKRAIEVTGIDIQVQPKEPVQTVEKSAELSDGALNSLSQLETQLPDSKLKSVISGLLARHRSEH
jgi:hypothetical protein